MNHVQPSMNKHDSAPLADFDRLKPVLLQSNYKLRLTPACLPTCCCLATFPLSDVIQTLFVLLPDPTEVRARKGSVSYGLGADFSLPHCLVGDKVSEAISSWHKRSVGRNLVVHRHGTALRQSVQEVPLLAVFFFSLFQPFCLKHAM